MKFPQLINTYSIVAYDPNETIMGVAVQSHWFAVGGFVPWIEPGVGAVATQGATDETYGPRGLSLMRAGKSSIQALEGLLMNDPFAQVRQVAMVDTQGNVMSHSGRHCPEYSGCQVGPYYAVQANLMDKATVWTAMGQTFECTQNDLAERMMQALEAGEEEGGDMRGRQSAALLVASAKPAQKLIFNIRVDDTPYPLQELRRLLKIRRAYNHGRAALDLLREPLSERQLALAEQELNTAMALMPRPDCAFEQMFHFAVALLNINQVEASLPFFRRLFNNNPLWKELLLRYERAGTFFYQEHQFRERVAYVLETIE